MQLPPFGFVTDIQQKTEQGAGVPWINQPVVPQVGAAVEGGGLAVEFLRGDLFEHVEHLGVGHQAVLELLGLGDNAQHFAGLCAAHHRGAAVGPGEDKARVQAAAAHRVVASTVGATDHDSEFRHTGVGHCLDHLRTVFDHPLLFRLGAHHETGGVVQKQQRRAALVAQLDKLRGFARALRRDGAVIANHPHGTPLDVQMGADSVGVELTLEFQQVGTVGQARQDFAHVVWFFRVIGDQPQQLFNRVQRFAIGALGGLRQAVIPGQQAHNLTHDPHAIGIVLGQVLSGAGGLRVHLRATQFFIGGDFAGGGLEQRWPGEEQLGLAAHHHHVIRQARLIRTAGRGRTMHHGDLRQAHGRHARLVGKAACAFDENLGGVVEVGAAAFGEGHHRQFVLHGDLLQAQGFLQPGGGNGAALDRAVIGHHQHAHAADIADTGDQPATGGAAVLVVVEFVAGQAGQFQERRAGVQQQVEALTGQQLAALVELGLGFLGLGQQGVFQLAQLGDGRQHGFAVLRERWAVGVDQGFNGWHGVIAPP